jgi:RsiW-degrading membrane proteinase PrsW (M82 family)
MLPSDPKILVLTFLIGIIPSFIWLFFWLKEDEKRPEPKGVLAMVFVLGMISVVFVIPVQQFVEKILSSYEVQVVVWAALEEIIKLLAVVLVLSKTPHLDEPIDWPIYLITAAVGFAALENILFLMEPFSLGENTVGLLTGQLRFLGSTLLHTVSSAFLGIFLGLSFHSNKFKKNLYLVVGMGVAVVLHSIFNFFIIEEGGGNFLNVFAFLWVAAVIVMLLFEKLRRMS